jgi:copper(I)-binding protein
MDEEIEAALREFAAADKHVKQACCEADVAMVRRQAAYDALRDARNKYDTLIQQKLDQINAEG